MLARQSRYIPAHVGPNLQKDTSCRSCHHATIAAANCSRIGPSRPGLQASAGAPVLATPRPKNRTPTPSKFGPFKPENQKSVSNFRYHFQVRFLDLKTGLFFWISIKLPLVKPKNGPDFGYGKWTPKRSRILCPATQFQCTPRPQKRDRTRVRFCSLAARQAPPRSLHPSLAPPSQPPPHPFHESTPNPPKNRCPGGMKIVCPHRRVDQPISY